MGRDRTGETASGLLRLPWHRRGMLFGLSMNAVLILFAAFFFMLIISNLTYTDFRTFINTIRDPEIQFAAKLSFITSSITTLIALLIGVPSAYALSRYKLPGASIIDTLIDLPIVLPPPVIGITLLILFRSSLGQAIEQGLGIKVVFTQKGIVVAQFVIATCFGIRALKAAFDSVNPRFEQVARTLGCSSFQAFRKITLPLAKTGILVALALVWTRAVIEFAPVLFFVGPNRWRTEILPISIFINMFAGKVEMALAVCFLMVLISLTSLLIFRKLGGQGYLW
jgi:molybdate transport system permease protein